VREAVAAGVRVVVAAARASTGGEDARGRLREAGAGRAVARGMRLLAVAAGAQSGDASGRVARVGGEGAAGPLSPLAWVDVLDLVA